MCPISADAARLASVIFFIPLGVVVLIDARCRLDTMASDEASKGVCSPRTWIALRRVSEGRATSLVMDQLKPRKESRHHENLRTTRLPRRRAANPSAQLAHRSSSRGHYRRDSGAALACAFQAPAQSFHRPGCSQRPKLSHAGSKDVNREAEPKALSRIGVIVIGTHRTKLLPSTIPGRL